MRLYLVRHAIAAENAPDAAEGDFERPLTAEGLSKMRRHAEALRRMGVEPAEIWTSPLVRARQTAEVLATGLDGDAPVENMDALRPDAAPRSLLGALRQRRPRGDVILVGHEPFLGELAAQLLTARMSDVVAFKKGAAACFEIEDLAPPIRGRLQWLLTPKALTSMV